MCNATPETIIRTALKNGKTNLSEHEAKCILAHYGIPVTRESLVRTPEELAGALKEYQFPVVMKVDSPDILHKTEAGAVRLGIKSAEESSRAFAEIMENSRKYKPEALINGVLVQEMLKESTECIVGMNQDQQFGPVLLFGLGGIFVEVLKDVALRVAPIDHREALEMMKETKGYTILQGVRGKPKADMAAIADVLTKMSQLSRDLESYLAEIDINPLMVFPEGQGAKAADALFVLRAPES
ncbi:MAG: acetate--CoA ligase family protein [Chloroflexi bacterium]|nr:acetate--CoA ligase family protein [Chloroflexota bacterium]